MTHNIVVGSRVKVLSCEGSFAYKDKIGQIMTVLEITHGDYPGADIIHCMIGHGQYPRRFELQPTIANGVDADGKLFNFTLPMLKPLQRVTTRSGQKAILVADPDEGLILVYASNARGWDKPHMAHENRSCTGSCDIIEVYEPAPFRRDLLDTDVLGKLVWRELDTVAIAEATAKAARVALLVKLGIARDEAYAAYVEATRVLEAF